MATAALAHGTAHGHGHTEAAPEPPYVGMVAEFASADALLRGAAAVRKAGYTDFECHSPFPVHGLDEAAGIPPTTLPYVVTLCGATGLATGFLMQWYTSSALVPELGVFSGYPIVISGKPHFAAHAVPVCFELTILLGSFGAFFGMLAYNGLPRFYNPLFGHPRFRRVTSDKLFLAIDATDKKFHKTETRDLLQRAGAARVDLFEEPTADGGIPALFWVLGAIMAVLALLPPVLLAKARSTTSEYVGAQRIVDKGMAVQPKYKAQSEGAFFADGRAMRPELPGTVAQGSLGLDSHLRLGLEVTPAATRTGIGLTAGPLLGVTSSSYAETLPPSLIHDETGKPSKVQLRTLMLRGQERYNIHCAACHGLSGNGLGLVHERAVKGENPAWVQPRVLNGVGPTGPDNYVVDQPDGRIFNTITYGRSTMAGMGSRIPLEDRWAIVLYVRALQRSQNARLADTTAEEREKLQQTKPKPTPAPAAN